MIKFTYLKSYSSKIIDFFLIRFIDKPYLNLFVSIVVTMVIGFIDYKTGYEVSLQFFYFVPLIFVSANMRINKIVLVLMSLFSSIIWFFADYYAQHNYGNFLYIWNTFSSFVVFYSFSLFFNFIIKNQTKIKKLNEEISKKSSLVANSIQIGRAHV